MRSLSFGCLLAVSLGLCELHNTQGVDSTRRSGHSHHHHSHSQSSSSSHSHSRLVQHIVSHKDLMGDVPCKPGYIRVFHPQLKCSQVSAPTAPAEPNLVVITDATCNQVLTSIRTKTPPYWDPEMQRCAAETRVGLLTQCAQKMGSNFTVALQGLCHFDTKILNSDFHTVKIVPFIPAVEVPTGTEASAQKKTSMSISAEKYYDNNTHPDPKTPDKPVEKWGTYPTDMTKSAQTQASIAQSDCLAHGNIRIPCSALAPGYQGGVIKSFKYEDTPKPVEFGKSSDPVILTPAEHITQVRIQTPNSYTPAESIKVASAPAKVQVPNPKWARFPSAPSESATRMAVESQQSQGVLPSAPTVVTIH